MKIGLFTHKKREIDMTTLSNYAKENQRQGGQTELSCDTPNNYDHTNNSVKIERDSPKL